MSEQEDLSFDAKFRNFREARNLNLVDLADQAGVPPTVLVKIERDLTPPPDRETLIQFSKAWHLSHGDTIDLFVDAGYLRQPAASFWQEDREILIGALRELFGPPPGARTSRLSTARIIVAAVQARISRIFH